MNCTLAARMVDGLVDGELDASTAAQVEEHLASCAACAALSEARVAMRTALRSSALRHAAPRGLRPAVVRQIGRAEAPPTAARRPAWWQALALGGSMAAIGAMGGWWLAQPAALDTFPDAVVARHVASLTPAGPRIDVASSDRHLVRPWFQGRLPFAPVVRELDAAGFELLGARLEHVGEREAVAVVYRLHRHVINVFSWRAQPGAAQREAVATIRGFNVVVWSDRDMDFAAVSDTDAGELGRFVAAYRAP